MKNFLLVLFCCAACAATAQQIFPVQAPIVRHKGGNPDSIYLYRDLDAAITAALDNDVFYLAGGMPYTISVVLNKKIVMYGTGYNTDTSTATGICSIFGTFNLGANSKGSLFTGINFRGTVVSTDQISEPIFFRRCKLTGYSTYSNTKAQLDLKECIIGYISAYITNTAYASTINASNCVFEQFLYFVSGFISANNCIFLCNATSGSSAFINSFTSTTITNSIFFLNLNGTSASLLSGGTPTDIQNCLVVGAANYISGIDTTSNIRKNVTFKDSVLVKRDLQFVQNSSDYHLQTSFTNLGTRYQNLGIYRFNGVDYPFKATPPVHIVTRDPRISTNGQSIIFTGKVIDGN